MRRAIIGIFTCRTCQNTCWQFVVFVIFEIDNLRIIRQIPMPLAVLSTIAVEVCAMVRATAAALCKRVDALAFGNPRAYPKTCWYGSSVARAMRCVISLNSASVISRLIVDTRSWPHTVPMFCVIVRSPSLPWFAGWRGRTLRTRTVRFPVSLA